MLFSGVRAFGVVVCWLGCVVSVWAQTPAPGQTTPPGYTLHVATRLVLTDVTVTDRQGNPVKGLGRSAFQILDNGKPQAIASFSEHTSAEQPQAGTKLGTAEFSNGYLKDPPPAFNVLLLDLTTIRIADQMYMAEQLQKFVAAMPPSGMLAVYTRAGDSVVPLQDFTTDRTLLRAAINKAVPRLQQPGSWLANDLDTLQQMLTLLRPYPGRKNLIWFTGGSNLALMADASGLPAFVDMRPVYDALESSRIAVYPVDARGLTTEEPQSMAWQQMAMEQTAEATGGRAFFNNNGLKQIAAHLVENGEDFYTLTYSPERPKFDNKWHKVKVVLQEGGGSYQLSYRQGYYDDGSQETAVPGERTMLRADGTTSRVGAEAQKAPILFSAAVQPAGAVPPGVLAASGAAAPVLPPLKKNQSTYSIQYTVRASDFVQQTADNKPYVTVYTGVLAVNRLGAHLARQIETAKLGINLEKFRANPDGVLRFEERINLPKGDEVLYILVWDAVTKRFGMVLAPVTVAKRAG